MHVKGACGRLRAVPCRAGLNIGGVHGLRELRIHCVCFAQPWPRRATCSPTVIRGNRLGLHGLFGPLNYTRHPFRKSGGLNQPSLALFTVAALI